MRFLQGPSTAERRCEVSWRDRRLIGGGAGRATGARLLLGVVGVALLLGQAANADGGGDGLGATHEADSAQPVWVGVVAAPSGPMAVSKAGAVVALGEDGRWKHVNAGGVGPDLVAAMVAGDRLFGMPRTTPMFRFDGRRWHSSRFGVNGKIVAATGSASAIAIGRQVFALRGGKWPRVGSAPIPVAALWAGADARIAVGGEGGLYLSRGGRWVRALGQKVTAIAGKWPWAWTNEGIVAVPRGKRNVVRAPITGRIAATTTSDSGDGIFVVDDGKVVALVIVSDAGPRVVSTPVRSGAVVGGVAAAKGRVHLAADGQILTLTTSGWANAEWHSPTPTAAASGPAGRGPARTR